MATRQQAERFLEPPPSAGGNDMTLTNRMNKATADMRAARTGQPATKPAATQQPTAFTINFQPATKPAATQQPMTLRQRQQQQLRGLTNRPAASPTAQMTQPEHNQLRERGNVPPVMAPSQGNAAGGNMVAGVDLNTSFLGRRWDNDIRNEHARAPRAPIRVVNPGARRTPRPGQSFSGRSSSIQRSSPGARPLNDFARGFPQ